MNDMAGSLINEFSSHQSSLIDARSAIVIFLTSVIVITIVVAVGKWLIDMLTH